ncbi:MAG: ABC transporter permease [Dehalococcoidia bacterium]
MATDTFEFKPASRLSRTLAGGSDFFFKLLRIAAFYVGLIVVWQLVADSGLWESYAFAGPTEVWDSLQQNWDNGRIQDAVQTSLKRLAIGFAFAFIIGITMGAAMGGLKWVDETVGSLAVGMQSLPSVTWLPLALIWYGLSERAIIFVVVMGSVFAISISARDGVRNIPPLFRRAGLTFGANHYQMLRYVVMPGMIPSMVQGLKLGWSFAWRSLMAAELLYVSGGLGFLLQLGRDLNNISQVMAVMVVIIAIGLTVDRVIFARLEGWVKERWGLA